ncbi:MAG: hypothetical protein AAF581_11305 [Planctomycetota bacterium]
MNWKSVTDLYARVDAEIAPHEGLCRLRGICCDFDRAEHVLFSSSTEAAYLLAHRSLANWDGEGQLCPFWQDGLCTAREHRPLGCRTYFCDPSWDGSEIYERYHRELEEVGARQGIEYRYAPWVELLREARRMDLDPPDSAS